MSKKRYFLILGCGALVIVLTLVGIMIRESYFFQERERDNSYCIDNLYANADKDSLYYDYIIKTLMETINDEDGVIDCKIDVDYLNGKIVSANVSVVAEDDEIDSLERSILDYVSQSIEISEEDIVLSYD